MVRSVENLLDVFIVRFCLVIRKFSELGYVLWQYRASRYAIFAHFSLVLKVIAI
jgi:hypothetical protein